MTIKNTSPAPKKNGLSAVDIIRKDAISHGNNPDATIIAVDKILKDPHYNLVQIGNTVFLLRLVAPFTVEGHIFTADNMMGVVKNYVSLVEGLKQQGVKKAYTYSDEPRFKQFAERSGLPVKITQDMKQVGEKMKPVFVYEMDM